MNKKRRSKRRRHLHIGTFSQQIVCCSNICFNLLWKCVAEEDAALCLGVAGLLPPCCVITACFLLPTCILELANECFNPIELPQCSRAPPSPLHCSALEMNTAANDL